MQRFRLFAVVLAVVSLPMSLSAQTLLDKTLRIDYTFSGTDKYQDIALDEISCFDTWAGRRHNLDSLILRGNGQISMRSATDGHLIYINSFSTLFQEWLTTEEATRVKRSFEATFLLPMPSEQVEIKVELFGFKGETIASFTHGVDPKDILIRHKPVCNAPCFKLLENGTPQDCIDVAIVAEGYTAAEQDIFLEDARTAMKEILSYEPFKTYRNRFNFTAVALESNESGVSVPYEGIWKDTALGSHFSTFYSDRYLTTLRLRKVNDCLSGLPYEHIIILANTDTYGGGGIYGCYTLTTAHHPQFKPVVVHEFGHSFAGLADEYYYDDQYVDYYYPDAEPWEQNITTMVDFHSKWEHLLPEDTAVPTAQMDKEELWKRIASGEDAGKFVGVYEGGGYQSKGVWRPFPDCRMHTNLAPIFCPVCQDAIRRYIEFNL